MAKITLKGTVKEVKPVQTYGDTNQYRKQSVILFIPGYVNEFGEKMGPDEEWELEASNQRIDTLKIADLQVGERLEVTTYISGVGYDRKDGSGRGYFINARIGDIKSHGKPDNDDLPF